MTPADKEKCELPSKAVEARERTGRRGAGGRPTREEAERRDARLLDVATNLFMERGFDGTSIDAVAEAAGVSKPTVYAHYHDKRDLFAAVLRSRIRRWLAPLSAAAEAQASEATPDGWRCTAWRSIQRPRSGTERRRSNSFWSAFEITERDSLTNWSGSDGPI